MFILFSNVFAECGSARMEAGHSNDLLTRTRWKLVGEEVGALPRRQHGEKTPRTNQEINPASQQES
jgi:hypothetical protein